MAPERLHIVVLHFVACCCCSPLRQLHNNLVKNSERAMEDNRTGIMRDAVTGKSSIRDLFKLSFKVTDRITDV